MAKVTKEKKKHPILKIVLIVLLVLAVAAGLFIYFAYRELESQYQEYIETATEMQSTLIGSEAPDFKVTTTDGEELTLSGLLKEKEVVLVNVFATWCGPCEREFPVFEKFYRQYGDKFAIVSVSGDSEDTIEDLREYKASHGLSFPMGQAGEEFTFVPVTGYPTSLIIDRDGIIQFCQAGTITSDEVFEDLITSFMGDSYDGSPVYLYSVMTYHDKEYLPGVTVKVTFDDGSETEVTTGQDGTAVIKMNAPHAFTAVVTEVPDGYKAGTETMTGGPASGGVMIKVNK